MTIEEYIGKQEVHPEIYTNATELINKFNRLMVYFHKDVEDFQVTMTSGYRSPLHNAKVGGAASSKHMSGQAIDIYDPRKRLAKWCVRNQKRLEEQGLWCEDPRATKNWMHLQSVPPRSGSRFFIPSVKYLTACATPLTEENVE